MEDASTNVEMYPLRVAYDGQAFLSANGGTGKGVQLRNLLGPYADRFVGLATPGKNYSRHPLVQGGFRGHQLWQQFSLPRLLGAMEFEYFLAPYNVAPLALPKTTKLILVLHDLILLEPFGAPTIRQRLNNGFRRFLIPRAVLRAHTILTVSEYTKRQIEERFGVKSVQVIPCTISKSWFIERNAIRAADKDDYILSILGNAPHKNWQRALEGYARFVSRSNHAKAVRLRVVGLSEVEREVYKRAVALGVSELVDLEPYITEEELQKLYRRARAVLVPSLMEGFGIPVLEAMASGTPVISSETTSLPEVGGEAAQYFSPVDTDEMGGALARVFGDRELQDRMIDVGLAQARRFHPDVVGRQVRQFWEHLAEVHGGIREDKPAIHVPQTASQHRHHAGVDSQSTPALKA